MHNYYYFNKFSLSFQFAFYFGRLWSCLQNAIHMSLSVLDAGQWLLLLDPKVGRRVRVIATIAGTLSFLVS